MSNSESAELKGTQRNPTRLSAIQYDYILNGYGLAPHYIQNIVSKQKYGAVGWGGPARSFQGNAKPAYWRRKSVGHKHAKTEYFIFYGTNPDKPDDLGGTVEFWIGEAENAEPYIITKPTIVVLPPHICHLPQVFRGYHGINASTVIYDAPLHSSYRGVQKSNPDFNVKKQADPTKFSRKYQSYVNEQDISRAAFYPSHKGKAQVILHHDIRHNPLTTHYTEVNLISGSGIGWGCGDMMQYSEYGESYQIRSLPHIHDVVETYCFIGTDPDNYHDLGGTIEFWIGEGDKAKKLTINKPTIMFIPPNTVHLPMWVSEIHTPIIATAILDTPAWSVYYTDVFPPTFEHESIPSESETSEMVFQLNYDKEKCLYPECQMCVDNCQVNGINLSVQPPVIGKPCLRCSTCASVCPTDAITVELRK